MGSDGHRWQAAMGAIAGALVADALHHDGATWSPTGVAIVQHAEDHLFGRPTAIDLRPSEAIAVGIGLSQGASPLLMDSGSVALLDHVRAVLDDPQHTDCDAELAVALHTAMTAASFETAVTDAASAADPVLVGALYGLHGGIGVVPAHLVSSTGCPEGRRSRRYLTRLTDRLLGLHRIDWYDPRNRRGPREVLPGLWLSNLFGLAAFADTHPNGLVVSLCDIEGRLDEHCASGALTQITFHLDDTPKVDANPNLDIVLDEVLATIADARAGGRPVLVHCRHGASRTGLVLRLLLIDELDVTADEALVEAQCLWPHTSTWNDAWNRAIERRSRIAAG